MQMSMNAYGISLGASTISAVEVSRDESRINVNRTLVRAHEGNPRAVLVQVLDELECGDAPILVTGRKFRHFTSLPSVTEPEATESALRFISDRYRKIDSVLSVGGETFMVYLLDAQRRIAGISSGNKCASGTGEFFLQQIKRMNLGVREAVDLAGEGIPYTLSGRCSVFCKSDCTHALNKGEPIPNVTSGLCRMIARKMDELLEPVPHNDILVVGGTAQNRVVIDFLREKLVERNPSGTIMVPPEAPYFEALGAASLALEKGRPRPANLFRLDHSSFTFLPRLSEFSHLVSYRESVRGSFRPGDRCLVGLDVGSTTTKAVLLRLSDNAILASEYLRTNGNPVEASRKCFRSLLDTVGLDDLEVEGIGVTGSGRRIAGLYCLTEGVINEIIAHAAAAAFWDPEVDTIFEIGGQDAKYTHLTNGVASDYAMNEACSAGTGSFLEESAHESLGVRMEDIASLALQADRPPNFSDQCAAFISSDIKNATHEGIEKEDILAGLVYSICFNYANRVKGNRPVGKKLFMQGGVCYNRAVPLAMASIFRRQIVVPPEPGLMGAFGVALEAGKRMERGILAPKKFSLAAIVGRAMEYEKPIVCQGGREKCDIRCSINLVRIEGRLYPFGGACNRYSDIRDDGEGAVSGRDYVQEIHRLAFAGRAIASPISPDAPTVGISTAFLTARMYPLYHAFFSRLGFRILLPDRVREEAFYRQATSMCFPAQIAMGLYEDLLDKRPDFLFMPHLQEVYVPGGIDRKQYCSTCLLVQGEPYWMRQAFGDEGDSPRLLCPSLSFNRGYEAAEPAFLEVAHELGFSAADARRAFAEGVEAQKSYDSSIKDLGREALADLHAHPERSALVVFGRVYNAYSPLANKGIPRKLTSRGQTIIPFEMLPFEDVALTDEYRESMHWEAGQRILRAAEIVGRDNQLFGIFVTNFLCAPDSFIVSYFRRAMKEKPSLTLELDEHTADAGISTRIEAFLDIAGNYLEMRQATQDDRRDFRPAEIAYERGRPMYVDSRGERIDLRDPRIVMLLPSMGKLGTQATAAVNEHFGIRTIALPEADQDALRLGRAPTTGKECLPMHVCLGSLLKWVRDQKKPGDKAVFFLPKAGGYCRLGQYNVATKQVIGERRLEDIALLSPGMEEGFLSLGPQWSIQAFRALTTADAMGDIANALMALAVEPEEAARIFDGEWEAILQALHMGGARRFYRRLRETAKALSRIPLAIPYESAPRMELTGEIFVRWDPFSNLRIAERLARKGFVVKIAPITEWLFYCNFMIKKGYVESRFSLLGRIDFFVSNIAMRVMERRIKAIFAAIGLYESDRIDIEDLMKYKRHFVPDCITGEHDLVASMTLRDGISKYCGIVSAGPFGCMQLRFAEALIAPQTSVRAKKRAMVAAGVEPLVPGFDDGDRIPFLNIESDGNPYPQLLDARLESFCLQAARVAERQGKIVERLDLS
jgi:predicted CoA-substrate-specific enzyme activase